MIKGGIKNDRFLEYIFPRCKFYGNNSRIYAQSKFFDLYSANDLQQLGYQEIFDVSNPKNVLNSRKRPREMNIFNKKEFISPSRIKLYIDEPFKSMIKEIEPEKIEKYSIEMAFGDKGNEFEEYCINILEDKLSKINKFYKITKLCQTIPDLNNYNLLKDSYLAIERGDPILYQPLLLDSETKIYGCPDLLIRADIFTKLFPYNKPDVEPLLSIKNNFGNYFYLVVDIKILNSKILGNGFLSSDKKMELNKLQVYLYDRMLSRIQGTLPYPYNFGFIMSPKVVLDNQVLIENNNLKNI